MERPPFTEYLGVELVRAGDGEAEVRLSLEAHHLNRRGVVHGGVLASLLDSALGAAVISAIPPSWWCATISLSVQFLEGVGRGRLNARGRVLRRGRKVAFAGGEVRDEGGRLVAVAQGSWHLWPYKPGRVESGGAEPWVAVRGSGRRLRVEKILAVGRNYPGHIREMGGEGDEPPVFFLKPPSALVHDGGTVWIPEGAGAVHHEVELVAVIGREGRDIPVENALDHVLGYAVGLDMTLRDLQSRAKARGEPWDIAKGFDTSAPVSEVAPREEVGDASDLEIRLEVNGQVRQSARTSMMVRKVPELVSEVSRWFTLKPGDLVFTGTPSGVGPVQPGDVLLATLEKVGTLKVRVDARSPEQTDEKENAE